MNTRHFLAFDLGATSGRSVLGALDSAGRLSVRELTRFPNAMTAVDGSLRWDVRGLFSELKRGLATCAAAGVVPDSVGIDTWGVDCGCVGADGSVVGMPYAYRDPRTVGAADRFFRDVMPARELYRRTGIQHLDFNTVFQLNEHRGEYAGRLLFMPDLLACMLTGEAVTEYTVASTGALLDARTGRFDEELLAAVGASGRFPDIVAPGTRVGLLREDVARETGLPRVPVVAVAGHDTASAVAAIPALDSDFAYLSSGTWSLMGVETVAPVIDEVTERHNITNEGGVCGTVRLLKNITGMWLLEQCLRRWREEGAEYSYGRLTDMAARASAVCVLDPDAPCFTAPDDMPAAIAAYCRATDQPVPRTHAEYARSIFESLARKYASTLDIFRSLAPHPVRRLHVIGGGSRNALLNRLTADACGIPVVAGPAEATALGNIMVQAMAAGLVSGLDELRAVIARNIPTETFNPKP